MSKITREVAELDFTRFVEAMDIDVDTDNMTEDDKKSFNSTKDRIVKAIEKGSLVINDNGEPVYTPQRGGEDSNPITFYEPTGASLMAMDKKGKDEDIRKLYSVMADMTKTSSGIFSKMKMSDLKVCQAITMLFLA